MRTVTLIGKPGCHLCDDARAVIAAVVAEHPGTVVEELSILDDPVLRERYADDIPVVLIDGARHAFWRVDADRLRRALDRDPAP